MTPTDRHLTQCRAETALDEAETFSNAIRAAVNYAPDSMPAELRMGLQSLVRWADEAEHEFCKETLV